MSLAPRIRPGRVLVLGESRQTVTVVRSLGRAAFEVTLGTERADSSTGLSRFVSDVWVYDNATPQRFYNHLEAFLRNERPDFVFATEEPQLRRLIEAAPRFEPLSTWVNPEFGTMARCFDQRAMYELASSLGVPTPPWAPFTSAEDWRRRAAAMGYPVVVKLNDAAGQVHERKPIIVSDAARFDAFLGSLPREPQAGSLVLQRFAPGVRNHCHVAAADGRLLAYFQQEVPRTGEPDDTGMGVAGVSVPPSPELRAHCETLTKALRYTGIGCIQFLVDERTGGSAFLEFEARMDGTAALPCRLGLDYPLLAVQLAAYRKARAAGRPDAARLLPEPLAADYAAGKSCHLAFDWGDPIPTIHMFWRKRLQAPLRRRLPLSRPLLP